MKWAIEEAKQLNSKIVFGGHEINPETFMAFRNEKRMDILPLVYRWVYALHNQLWRTEYHDQHRLLQTLSGEAFAEILDKHRVSWFIKLFEKYSPLQKRILIDQRDVDLFYNVYRDCPGQKVVAVVNQWHTPGIEAHWRHTTGTELKGEPINPVGDMDIERLLELNLVNDVLREFTSKLTKSEPADSENFLTQYHKKTMEAERARHVHFHSHDDPHMPGNEGGHHGKH
jgi:pheromone shutdown protein TraB